MKLSRYLFSHQVDEDWFGLYTPFEHAVCFVRADTWRSLLAGDYGALDPSGLRELTHKKMLVDDDFDASCLQPYKDRALTHINAMYLVVVQQCNMACKYCVVENNVVDPTRMDDRMSIETASAAVELFAKVLDGGRAREARVTYYGGEPTMNPAVIKHTLPMIRNIRARGLTRPVEAVMITNGLVFREDLADLFAAYGAAVCVSIDGPAAQHDAARVTHQGCGTHHKVLESIRRYRAKGLRMGLSCTIGRHNVEHLAGVARYFVEQTGIRDIEFQMPYQVPDEGNDFYVPMEEATDRLLEACDLMIDELGVDEYTTLRRLESFIKGHWRHRDCGAAGGQIVVSPKGQLGPCHSLVGSGRFFSGDVRDPKYDLFADPLFDEWSSRIPVNMPECEGCPFIALCGGGCPYNALTRHGTIWAKDPQVCPYLKKLVPWILERLWFGRDIRSRRRVHPATADTVLS